MFRQTSMLCARLRLVEMDWLARSHGTAPGWDSLKRLLVLTFESLKSKSASILRLKCFWMAPGDPIVSFA